jgi:diphthine methyl ester acylhydrolase
MAQDSNLVKSLLTLTLDLPPSCIEFCPSYPGYFVVGTYDLRKDDAQVSNEEEPASQHLQIRNGSLVTFRLTGEKVYVDPRLSHKLSSGRLKSLQ